MPANDYLTQADIEADRPDYTHGTAYDTIGALVATQASRLIDKLCGRPPGYFYAGTASARYFDGIAEITLWVDDMAAAPTIVAVAESGDVDGSGGTGGDYTTWAATDYYLLPMNAASDVMPYYALAIDALNGTKSTWYGYRRGVKITAQWGGYTSVPADIKRVTAIEAKRMMNMAAQDYRDTGGIIELGKLTYTKAVHPLTALVVAHYKKVSI